MDVDGTARILFYLGIGLVSFSTLASLIFKKYKISFFSLMVLITLSSAVFPSISGLSEPASFVIMVIAFVLAIIMLLYQ